MIGDFAPFLVAGLALGAVYAMSGIGLVILCRATGELNFAMGATGALAAFVAWEILDADLGLALAMAGGMAASALVSGLYGGIVSPRLGQRDAGVKAVATLGLALILLGAMYWIWSDTPRRLSFSLNALAFRLFDVRVTGERFLAFVMLFVIAGLVALFLARTRTGMHLRALANDRQLASVLGISVHRLSVLAWVISGLLSGLSGIVLARLITLEAGVLTFMVIPAIAAAIIGRLNSLGWTIAGGLAIGLLEALATPIPHIGEYRNVAPFLLAFLFIIAMAKTLAQAGNRRS